MRLIYLSPVPWCSFTQRPHEFIDYFHKTTGGEVLWIDPYPTRLPALDDFKRLRRDNGDRFRATPKWLSVLRPSALPLEPIPVIAAFNGLLWRPIIQQACAFGKAGDTVLAIGKPSALALTLLETLEVSWSVYDAMDDFPEFHAGISRRSMGRNESAIARRVSRLVVSSTNLVQKFSAQSRNAELVLNACRSDLPDPRGESKNAARPIVGYIGTLGRWFDWDMLIGLARSRPNCDFQLIGPMFSSSAQKLPSNVAIQPPLAHSAALASMRDFDVGLIPFKKNLLTASVDPIKYYEYRAMGLPVLSSAFGEMELRAREDDVFILNEVSDLGALLDQALEYKTDAAAITQFRKQNSWERRFAAAGLFV